MIYGYARVSSKGQMLYGTSLDDQEAVLIDNGAVEVFKDAYTGTKMSRPEFNKLLAKIQPGDTLMVVKLDRIARSATEGCELIKDMLNKGITVHVLNMGVIDNTPTGRLILGIMFSFAEFERDMIFERTQEGKNVKRNSDPNYKEGRKEKAYDEKRFEEFYNSVKKGEISVTVACKELDITRAKWYRIVEKVG